MQKGLDSHQDKITEKVPSGVLYAGEELAQTLGEQIKANVHMVTNGAQKILPSGT